MSRFIGFLLFLRVLAVAVPPDAGGPPLAPVDDLHNPKPSKDEWYKPPEGWESTAPGTPLRVRPHAYRTPPVLNWTDVVQVLFRTTDSHNQPSYSATTLFIPHSHAACLNKTNTSPESCSRHLLSYQDPYDTSCVDRSPSWNLQNKDPWGEITLGLNRGWFVAVPDYEGPRASFGSNMVAAHAILDSVRALLRTVGDFGFRTNESRVALWGYSSAGTATAWAMELAPSYAPELRIDGVVVGGMTANQTESSLLLSGKDVSGLLVQGLLGITNEYPEGRAYLDSKLKKEGIYNAKQFYLALGMSGKEALEYFLYQDVYEYFHGGISDVFAKNITQLMELEGIPGRRGTPKTSMFGMCHSKYFISASGVLSPCVVFFLLIKELPGLFTAWPGGYC